MILAEIKDQYVLEHWRYSSWDLAISVSSIGISEEDVDEIALRYARRRLEQASNRANLIVHKNARSIKKSRIRRLVDALKAESRMQINEITEAICRAQAKAKLGVVSEELPFRVKPYDLHSRMDARSRTEATRGSSESKPKKP